MKHNENTGYTIEIVHITSTFAPLTVNNPIYVLYTPRYVSVLSIHAICLLLQCGTVAMILLQARQY